MLLGYYADGGVRLQSRGTVPRTPSLALLQLVRRSFGATNITRKKESFLHIMSKIGQHGFSCAQAREIKYNVCRFIS